MTIKGKQLKTDFKNFEQTMSIGGKDYKLTLNFNVLAELEDIYGDIPKALDDMMNMKVKAIRALIYAIMKDADDDDNLTLKQVGKMLDLNFIQDFVKKMGVVLNNDMPEKSEDAEDLGE